MKTASNVLSVVAMMTVVHVSTLSLAHAAPGGLTQLRAEFDAFRAETEARLDDLESRMSAAEGRLNDHDLRLDAHQARLDDHDTVLSDHAGQLAGLDLRMQGAEQTLLDHEDRIAELEAASPFVRADLVPGVASLNGDPRESLLLDGLNLAIRNGSGAQDAVNGLGNVVVGYDAPNPDPSRNKSGSHNVVVGTGNGYTSHSGIVSGDQNFVGSAFAAAIGGQGNGAFERWGAVVIGGTRNDARGQTSTVIGGDANTSTGGSAVVLGGISNTAALTNYVVVGGEDNDSSGPECSAGGGGCRAGVVVGGHNNEAYGQWSVAIGGQDTDVSPGETLRVRMCNFLPSGCM